MKIFFNPFGFMGEKKPKEKEFVITWQETKSIVVKAKDADEAIEKYHQDKIERTSVPLKENFLVERL